MKYIPDNTSFFHSQSAHCESGVAANLLSHGGLHFSEAMAFGIGGGLFFGYLPFIRLNGMPLVTYRSAAGKILKRLGRIPGVEIEQKRYRHRQRAMAELDELLARGVPVGLQTGVFWLPYFPTALRFHFNAHNLVVYGKEDGDYLISDPVFPGPVRCAADDLARARFASGALAPRGKMYYLRRVPAELDRGPHILQGIDSVCRTMLGTGFPLIGIQGMRLLAGRMERWPKKLGEQGAALHLGHVVRMQEEIGTGGGGFRFMYAAYLQESAEEMGDGFLRNCSATLTEAGDSWRHFAVMAARVCKDRPRPGDTYAAMAEQIRRCALLEENVFKQLRQWLKQ